MTNIIQKGSVVRYATICVGTVDYFRFDSLKGTLVVLINKLEVPIDWITEVDGRLVQ